MLLCILGFAAYFRFVNFPLRYGFDFDPTRDALIVADGTKHLHFPLVGPKSGIGPFNFGPWYYFELIIFSLVFPVPFAPWIFIGIMSVCFVVAMYFIGKALEGKTFGLLLALLAAFSPEQVGPTDGLSNPNLVPIHAALTVLLFIHYMKTKTFSWYWILVWGLLFGIGINHHYQMVLLSPLPLLAFLYKRNKRSFTDALVFIVGTAASFIPLVIYNIQNNWKTITGFIFFITYGRAEAYFPYRWLFYLRDFWLHFISMVFGIPIWFTIPLLVVIFFTSFYAFIKKQVSVIYVLMLITFVIDFVFYRYFAVPRQLYYVLFFHPFLFIFFGFTLWQIKKIKYGWVCIVLLFITMLPFVWQQNYFRARTNADQVLMSTIAKEIEQKFPENTISIFGCSKESMNFPQGVAFFLHNDSKLAEDGIPVLLLTQLCTKNILMNQKIRIIKLKDTTIITVANSEVPNVERLSWKQVTPASVFKDNLEN